MQSLYNRPGIARSRSHNAPPSGKWRGRTCCDLNKACALFSLKNLQVFPSSSIMIWNTIVVCQIRIVVFRCVAIYSHHCNRYDDDDDDDDGDGVCRINELWTWLSRQLSRGGTSLPDSCTADWAVAWWPWQPRSWLGHGLSWLCSHAFKVPILPNLAPAK